MPTWQLQGRHRWYREADLVLFEVHGMFELPDVQHMYTVFAAIVHDYGYALTVFDADKAAGITADSRRYVADKSRTGVNDGATAVVGASLPIRTVVTLIRNASRLIGRPRPPMQFFATSAEGVAWLDTQRSLFRTKVGRYG